MVGLKDIILKDIIKKATEINKSMTERGLYITIDLEELVYNYPTKHKHGFIQIEEADLLVLFENLNMDKYHNAMRGNTCMMDEEDGIITYHCDVLGALKCALENRDLTVGEWD